MKEIEQATLQELRIHRDKLMTALEAISAFAESIRRIDLNEFQMPELGDIQARFKSELTRFKEEIANREATFEPYARCVHQRMLYQIPAEIKSIQYRINDAGASIAKKRKALLDAGIELDQATLICPDYDASSDQEAIAALEIELAAWQQFDAYAQERYLPDGYGDICAKISPYNAHLPYIHKRPE